jgi:hypothetical protein
MEKGELKSILMGRAESESRAIFCQAVSPWDEPCLTPATKHCEQCNRWFCQAHFGDPNWHSCAEDVE